ncbi:DUF3219 family protein [Niallia nealsonii]|uniref:DUF3219 domain-containing protein n=1 Tax=Niallia nealsonii TaxID=115979 RepID=A0A2N0Z532_9BACI|nr:DUF3219 family protein [Niallia nealsonii]PKG24613.1 DUF3219 domain-containing protein [Niallia nealsonii]
MPDEIVLDGESITVGSFKHEKIEGFHKISVVFPVTSEEYHRISTLLYKGTFAVFVPELDLSFRGTIQQYFTSITDLYKQGNVGEFTLSLIELKG